MASRITLRVNGRSHTLAVDDPQMPLLYALRNQLALHGPRFGCGLAQCGSCTVHEPHCARPQPKRGPCNAS